ncbi:HAD-IA family hydrolase [Candidatus Dojkabacteria bacterium]|nr:HAD-IA family hydrolase [Candidatus Dojkabacteria bacterium]
MNKMKHIFFDLDGTLVDEQNWAKEALSKTKNFFLNKYKGKYKKPLVDKLFSKNNLLSSRKKVASEHTKQLHKTEFRRLYFNEALKPIKDPNIIKEVIVQYSKNKDRPPPLLSDDTRTVVKYLSQKYILTLLSNSHTRIDGSGIETYFKHTVRSIDFDKKIRKPDPAIFNHALKIAGASKDTTIMIGDTPKEDILGAKKAGLKVIWFNPNKENFPNSIPRPNFEIHNFLELMNIL